MPRLPLCVLVIGAVLATACASDDAPGTTPSAGASAGGSSSGGNTPGNSDARTAETSPLRVQRLSADVLPFDLPERHFATDTGERIVVSVEPTDAGGRMKISGDYPADRHIDLIRRGDSIFFSDGPSRAVETLRVGATPGDRWSSSGREIHFVGWQRVETAAGTFDAALIQTSRGSDDFRELESWYLAVDEGLVRYDLDAAGTFRVSMSRVNAR